MCTSVIGLFRSYFSFRLFLPFACPHKVIDSWEGYSQQWHTADLIRGGRLGETLSQPTTHIISVLRPEHIQTHSRACAHTRLASPSYLPFDRKEGALLLVQNVHHVLVSPAVYLMTSLLTCPGRFLMPPPSSAVTLTTTAAPPSLSWVSWWCRRSWSWPPPSSAGCSDGFDSCCSFSRSHVPGTEGGCWIGRAASTPGSDQ